MTNLVESEVSGTAWEVGGMLCALCLDAARVDPEAAQSSSAIIGARRANALIDANGDNFRAQVEARLLGGEPPSGEYGFLG